MQIQTTAPEARNVSVAVLNNIKTELVRLKAKPIPKYKLQLDTVVPS